MQGISEGRLCVIHWFRKHARELVEWQHEVAEAENSLAESAELEVGLVERVAPVLRHLAFAAVQEDGRAAVEDALRRALHHQDVLLRVRQLMYRYLHTTRQSTTNSFV